jgi:hypothetical protein
MGQADPEDVLGVGVVVGRDAALDRRLDHRDRDRVGLPDAGDGQRAADAVVVARAVLEVLGLLEVRQDVGVGPAGRAVVGPVVEV